jgi:hypothetical protein
MEKILGTTFENDYKKFYLSGKLGQKRFAKRWGCSKGLIFDNNLRGGKRSWTQMLNLQKRSGVITDKADIRTRLQCENCNIEILSLDGAHWVERVNGGSEDSSNIAKLCPNCHRMLDRNHSKTIESVRKALLYRVSKSIIEKGGKKEKMMKELVEKITPIILHRRNKME